MKCIESYMSETSEHARQKDEMGKCNNSGSMTHLLLDVFTYSFPDWLRASERFDCTFYFTNDTKLRGR